MFRSCRGGRSYVCWHPTQRGVGRNSHRLVDCRRPVPDQRKSAVPFDGATCHKVAHCCHAGYLSEEHAHHIGARPTECGARKDVKGIQRRRRVDGTRPAEVKSLTARTRRRTAVTLTGITGQRRRCRSRTRPRRPRQVADPLPLLRSGRYPRGHLRCHPHSQAPAPGT